MNKKEVQNSIFINVDEDSIELDQNKTDLNSLFQTWIHEKHPERTDSSFILSINEKFNIVYLVDKNFILMHKIGNEEII